jgi:hypothetical protein
VERIVPPLIDVRNLTKTYWLGEVTVAALGGVTVDLDRTPAAGEAG